MTQEEKQLLLKDLCGRLPYGVCVLVHDTFEYSTVPYENVYLKSSDISSLIDSISLNERYNIRNRRFNRIVKERKDFLEFKPYLRPMSSMTMEEKKEYESFIFTQHHEWDGHGTSTKYVETDDVERYTTWLNKKMFDYRGLIPMGLALEATKDMYKTE